MSRILRSLIAVLAAGLLLTGCEFSIYKMPLPGGADVGDDPIVVNAKFRDVLDLVPQSTVKFNDVTIGKVTDVELDGFNADVELTIRRDVEIPANAIAEIRQTSLLGEKFVSLATPTDPQGRLEDGAEIGLDNTSRNPEVEEVLGALSLILNGGGVAQLKTISHELNIALEGREGSARSVLQQIRLFAGALDQNKGDIVNAIDALNRLAVSANRHRGDIESALDNLPAALKSLEKQRSDLVRMLGALGELGDVGTQVIAASKTATIDTLRQLNPVLTQLAAAGDDLANAVHVFLTYPFVDEVVGRDPQVARNLHMGDYTNLSVQLDINLGTPQGTGVGGLPLPNLPGLPGLPRAAVGAEKQTSLGRLMGHYNPTLVQALLPGVAR